MRRPSRIISVTPSCSSSTCIWRLTALCVSASAPAAAVALPRRSRASIARKDAIEGKKRRGKAIYSVSSYVVAKVSVLFWRGVAYIASIHHEDLMKGNAMSLDSPAIKPKDAPDLSRFDWEDPFRFDDQLEEDERMIAQSARTFAQEKLQPRVIKDYADEA